MSELRQISENTNVEQEAENMADISSSPGSAEIIPDCGIIGQPDEKIDELMDCDDLLEDEDVPFPRPLSTIDEESEGSHSLSWCSLEEDNKSTRSSLCSSPQFDVSETIKSSDQILNDVISQVCASVLFPEETEAEEIQTTEAVRAPSTEPEQTEDVAALPQSDQSSTSLAEEEHDVPAEETENVMSSPSSTWSQDRPVTVLQVTVRSVQTSESCDEDLQSSPPTPSEDDAPLTSSQEEEQPEENKQAPLEESSLFYAAPSYLSKNRAKTSFKLLRGQQKKNIKSEKIQRKGLFRRLMKKKIHPAPFKESDEVKLIGSDFSSGQSKENSRPVESPSSMEEDMRSSPPLVLLNYEEDEDSAVLSSSTSSPPDRDTGSTILQDATAVDMSDEFKEEMSSVDQPDPERLTDKVDVKTKSKKPNRLVRFLSNMFSKSEKKRTKSSEGRTKQPPFWVQLICGSQSRRCIDPQRAEQDQLRQLA